MKTARRGFLRTLAVAPLAPAALAPQVAPAPAGPPAGYEEVAEALAEAVKRQFGAHIDAAELEVVKKELVDDLERSDRLRRAARLRNADAPVDRFEARPPERTAEGKRR
jgi:hypothetical protein